MHRLNEVDSTYVAEEVSGFTKQWVENGVFSRQVDLLLLGFSYAVQNRILPENRINRHDLLRAGALDTEVRLALEAVAPWYARQLEIPPPKDQRTLLDFICRVGSAGIKALQAEWKDRSKSQIESWILRLLSKR